MYNENFNLCCNDSGIEDLRFMGKLITYSNCIKGDEYIACKLDRAFVNDDWKIKFPFAIATFLNHSIFDHTFCLVNCGLREKGRKIPFKFFNIWTQHERFLEIIKKYWKSIDGSLMFRLVMKLKSLKRGLKELNKNEF